MFKDLRNGSILVKDNKGNIQRYVLAKEKTPKRQRQQKVPSKRAANKPPAGNERRTMNVSNDLVERPITKTVVVRIPNLTTTDIHGMIAKGLHNGRIRDIKNAFGALPSKYICVK